MSRLGGARPGAGTTVGQGGLGGGGGFGGPGGGEGAARRRAQDRIDAQKRAEANAAAAAARAREQKLVAEAAAARAEFNRLAAARRAAEEEAARNAKAQQEKKEKEERQARLQKEQEEAAAARRAAEEKAAADAAAAKAREDARNRALAEEQAKTAAAEKLQQELSARALLGGLGTLTPQEEQGLTPQSLASLSRMNLTPRQESMLQDYAKEEGLDADNFAFTPSEGIFGLQQQALIRDITTGEIIGRPSPGIAGPTGAVLATLGVDTSGINFGTDPTADRGGRKDERQAASILPIQEEQDKKEEQQQEVLSGFTGDARGSSPQFISSIPTGGVTRLPAATNYMDYLKSAFTPVNLASPFGGAFSSNPIYRAAQGGFIGFMDEPLNIMYPSNGNMVVHDGISGILKKYKEIRSEL